MKLNWPNTIKALILFLILLFISTIILNLFYYFDIFSNNVIKYVKLICSIFSFLITGLYMGKNSPNKGYLYGLRLSFLIVLLFIIFGIIFSNLTLSRIIYYFIITFCVTFGSMIGINKKTL